MNAGARRRWKGREGKHGQWSVSALESREVANRGHSTGRARSHAAQWGGRGNRCRSMNGGGATLAILLCTWCTRTQTHTTRITRLQACLREREHRPPTSHGYRTPLRLTRCRSCSLRKCRGNGAKECAEGGRAARSKGEVAVERRSRARPQRWSRSGVGGGSAPQRGNGTTYGGGCWAGRGVPGGVQAWGRRREAKQAELWACMPRVWSRHPSHRPSCWPLSTPMPNKRRNAAAVAAASSPARQRLSSAQARASAASCRMAPRRNSCPQQHGDSSEQECKRETEITKGSGAQRGGAHEQGVVRGSQLKQEDHWQGNEGGTHSCCCDVATHASKGQLGEAEVVRGFDGGRMAGGQKQ